MIAFDASTLILLAKIELLRLVVEAAEVVIPAGVETESTQKDTFDAGLVRALIQDGRIKIETVKAPERVKQIMKDFHLEEGEAQALDLARTKRATLATDDGLAIKGCKVLGVEFVTAIHFLIRAYERGAIGKEMTFAKLEKLKRYGRYDLRIIEDARNRLGGEKTWE